MASPAAAATTAMAVLVVMRVVMLVVVVVRVAMRIGTVAVAHVPTVPDMTPPIRRIQLVLIFLGLLATLVHEIIDQRRKRDRLRWMMVLGQDHDPAEQAAIHAGADVSRVIVERPRAHHVVLHVEPIAPHLPGTDFVGPPPVGRLRAERPGSV